MKIPNTLLLKGVCGKMSKKFFWVTLMQARILKDTDLSSLERQIRGQEYSKKDLFVGKGEGLVSSVR